MNQPNRQRAELAVIVLFIIIISILVWNITPYTSMPPRVEPVTESAPSPSPTAKTPADEQWKHGKELFKSNCASCHNPKVAQTGPALMGVARRWEDAGSYQGKTGKQWLYAWIKDWHEPVGAKYPYAVTIQNYSPSEMNMFPTLKDEDIDAILHYVEASQAGQPVAMH